MRKKKRKELISECNITVSRIQEDYHPLHGAMIRIVLRPQRRGSMKALRAGKDRYLIEVDYRKYKNASNEELLGALAHELAHFEEYSRMSTLAYKLFRLRYYMSENTFRRYTRDIERAADMLVIRRGYGDALLRHRQARRKAMGEMAYGNAIRVYMSNEEIGRRARGTRSRH